MNVSFRDKDLERCSQDDRFLNLVKTQFQQMKMENICGLKSKELK